MADESIHEATVEDIKGKLASLTGKDASVVAKMATTFKALCGLADFSGPPKTPAAAKPKPEDEHATVPSSSPT